MTNMILELLKVHPFCEVINIIVTVLLLLYMMISFVLDNTEKLDNTEEMHEAKDPVPLSVLVKNEVRHQQLQQRLKQAQILKPIATKQNRGMSDAVLQPCPGNSNSSSQLSPSVPHTSPHPLQQGIDMKPSSGSPVAALQLQLAEQLVAAGQTVSGMVAANYGKGNPLAALQLQLAEQLVAAKQTVSDMVAANAGLMAPTQQMKAQTSQMMPGVPNRKLNMENVKEKIGKISKSWENSSYVQNQQPHQSTTQPLPNPPLALREPSQIMGGPNTMTKYNDDIENSTMANLDPSVASMPTQQLPETLKSPASAQQQQHLLMGGANPMPDSNGNSTMGPPQVMSNPSPSIANMQRSTQAWQQQEVLDNFKANPQLMAASIKQRTAQEQQQQQKQQRQLLKMQQQQQLLKMQQQQQLLKMQQMLLNEDNMIAPPPQNVQYKHLFTEGPNSMPNPDPSIANVQQLIQLLKSAATVQQQQQVLAILKAHPQLMAAFIRERTAQQQQQQVLLNEGN